MPIPHVSAPSPTALAAALLAAACGGRTLPVTPAAPVPPPETIEAALFLVGDGGAPAAIGEPVLAALRAAAAGASGERVVVFLGDNVYPRGIPDSADPGRAEAVRRLATQAAASRGVARALFVPGNHDWAQSKADGWQSVLRAEQALAALGWGARQVPGGGCPGPAVVDVAARLRLVFLDTQWWLHTGPKPGPGQGDCRAETPAGVTDSLGRALRSAGTRHVVVVGHHPLASGGVHGGRFSWQDHIFPLTAAVPWLWLPLPILGSLYPLARKAGWSDQDMSGSRNVTMRESLSLALRERPPLLYASGHDHSLQVLDGTVARHIVVSGAGFYGHTSHVAGIAGTRFAARASGFMRLDVLRDGRVRLGVIEVDKAGQRVETFSMWLDTRGP